MKHPARFITLLLLSVSVLSAQNWDYYSPLQSKGKVPADITEAYTNKYEREREQISRDDRRKARKRQDDFYRRSEFFINEFLTSGDILFGDTITKYCESILDLILKDKPSLRKQLRVYTVKSPVVNALAAANGIIFVNLGLMAEVENEAQLAYILAHEVIHYEKNHVLNQYIEQERIKDGEDLYSRTSQDEKLLALSTYSKSQELEADEIGFEKYFVNTGYSQQAALFVMDVLQYSYLPFDEIKFDREYLHKDHFEIPDKFLLEEVAPITAEADYDDTESSHPNIKKRKEAIQSKLGKLDGKEYIISEDLFKHCQRLARYEMTRLYLNRRQYPDAIYNTYLLKKKYGEDRYQRISIAKALQAATAYRNENELFALTANWREVEGESQQVYHILSKFEKKDLNTLAVTYAYDLLRDYPDDENALRLFHRNLYDLVFENDLRPDDFAKKLPTDSTGFHLDSLRESMANRSSKIAHIQEKRQSENENENPYYSYAFVDYWQDSLFTNRFAELAKSADERSFREKRNYRSSQRSKYEPNKALGINKVVCVSPLYLKLDEREEDGIKYLTTDEGLENYRQQLVEISEMVDLDLEMLDFKYLTEEDTELYNEIALLKTWIGERVAHENNDAMISDFDQVQALREKYNTDYISYTGNLSLRVREEHIATQICYSIVLYPLLPFTIANLVTPDYESFNFFFLFDLRNGDALMAEYNYYETNDRPDYVRSIIYNHLIQVKDKPKQ